MRKYIKKMNNHGFSLVELLIAMAILGVVSLTIYSFMVTGSRFYGKQSADADIQSEAQLVANTISDLIVDCEVNISYDDQISNQINPAGGGAGGTVYAEGKALEISNSDYQFVIFKNDTNLFYLERRPDLSNPNQYEAYNINNAQLLAQNITEFEVDLSRVSGKGKGKNIVTFTMTYESMGRSYRGNYQVNLRNDISVSANSITPEVKEANLTRVNVTPSPITVEVKGKENPAFMTYMQEFTAHSDAVNVTRDDLYTWSVKDAEDNVVGFAVPGGPINEKHYIANFTDAANVPSYIRIIATATVPNKATNTYASGEAIVYFKKLLGLAVVPTSGVTSDKVEPQGRAVFQANVTDYNMTPSEKKCSWKLEYRIGNSGEFLPCTDSGIASGRLVGSSYSSELGCNVASSYVVQLGSKANSNYTFRITIQNQYDPTWTDEYTFTVVKPIEIPGVNSASRGVEVDLTAYFKSDKGRQAYDKVDFPHPLSDDYQIVGVVLRNSDNYDADSDLYKIIERDGNFYMYLDFDAWRYPDTASLLGFYDSHLIEMALTTEYVDGADHSSCGCNANNNTCRHTQTVNWYTEKVELTSAKPVENTDIVIAKGTAYDAACHVNGYNVSKKNMIGIYLQDENSGSWNNANANEVGMLDLNRYIAVDYTGTLGNRYVLIQNGAFRITAKAEESDYPMDAIPMMITLDPMYRIANTANKTDYLERSRYYFDVYVANVEGTDLYVQGPSNLSDISSWKVKVNGNEQAVVLNTDLAISAPSAVTAKFTEVTNGNDQLSYYQMTIGNQKYYWNSTYHCWKRISK